MILEVRVIKVGALKIMEPFYFSLLVKSKILCTNLGFYLFFSLNMIILFWDFWILNQPTADNGDVSWGKSVDMAGGFSLGLASGPGLVMVLMFVCVCRCVCVCVFVPPQEPLGPLGTSWTCKYLLDPYIPFCCVTGVTLPLQKLVRPIFVSIWVLFSCHFDRRTGGAWKNFLGDLGKH